MRLRKCTVRIGWTISALVGVLATAAALAAGHLLAGVFAPAASPYLAVGNAAIDLTPEPVKSFAIRQFGESDKLVLLGGMAVVILLLAAVAGISSRRNPGPGLVLIGLFGALGVAAALARSGTAVLEVLPSALSLVTGVGTFLWLHTAACRRAEAFAAATGAGQVTAPDNTGVTDDATALDGTGERDTVPSRRRFLVSTAAVSVSAGVAGAGGQLLAGRYDIQGSRASVSPRVPRSPAFPDAADFAETGTPSFITPNKDFYRVDTLLSVPRIRAQDWRLRIHGMVDRELVLSFDDLLRRRQVNRTITMTCVSNEVGGPYISTATFTGVPLRELLDEAGVRDGAEQVFSTSEDGYTAGTPVDVLTEPDRDALLAYGMNGEALPAEHGFPARMVTPGLYGYLSATKWVVDMELTTFDKQTYWEKRGWAQRAPIKTQSRIDRPKAFEKVPAGRFTAAGIAWAQPGGIERVEVRVDGGPWQRAELSEEVNGNTWRMWRVELNLAAGGRRVECRATDRTGYTQTNKRVPPIPDGATGWHSIFCTAG